MYKTFEVPSQAIISKYSAIQTVVYNERGPGLSELEGRRANPQNPKTPKPQKPIRSRVISQWSMGNLPNLEWQSSCERSINHLRRSKSQKGSSIPLLLSQYRSIYTMAFASSANQSACAHSLAELLSANAMVYIDLC